jgi:two-component system, sensor histidine kinase LadS
VLRSVLLAWHQAPKRWAACVAKLLVCLSAGFIYSAALAQEFDTAFSSSQSIALAQPLQWLAVPEGSVASPNSLEPLSAAWQNYAPGMVMPTGTGQDVWLRFALPATAAPQMWFLRIPRLTILKASLYTPTEQGTWAEQSAGESIAPAQWPLHTRAPTFELQTSSLAPRSFYVRYQHHSAVTERPQLVSPIDLSEGTARIGIVMGLMWGVFGLLALMSVVGYGLVKARVFLWFSAFVICYMFTQLTFMGYGSWRVWHHSAYLNQVMGWVMPFIALASATWYAAQASNAKNRHPTIYRALQATAIMCLVVAATLLINAQLVPRAWRNWGVLVVVVVVFGSLVWMVYKRRVGLPALLVSYLLLSFAAAGRLAYNWGWVQHIEVVQLLSATFSFVALMWMFLTLTWRYRATFAAAQREAALEKNDATTGLLRSHVVQDRLPRFMARAKRYDKGCGVLMLRWLDYAHTGSKGAAQRGDLLGKLGAIVRKATREYDTAARFSDDTFLLLIEGPVSRDALSALSSQIIAACIRGVGKAGEEVSFNMHIALWQSHQSPLTAAQVLEALQSRLDLMAVGAQRKVQFVDDAFSAPHAQDRADIAQRQQEVLAKIKAIEAVPIEPRLARTDPNAATVPMPLS